jgi:hypothetical protein
VSLGALSPSTLALNAMSVQQSKSLVLGDEMFHLIMSDLNDRSLSVVCRTTKLFHKYAVGILWRSLDDITPLMHLFPGEVVTYERDNRRFVSDCTSNISHLPV